MKRITFLMTGLLVLMLACDNPVNNVPEDAPDVFRELVDEGIRVDADKVNAHVYGSFSITFQGSPGVITTGAANFPGNPKNAGTCDNGMWINPKGKPTSGDLEKPHPHCVGEGSASMTVVLEPISVRTRTAGSSGNEFLHFSNDQDTLTVARVGGGGNPHTEASGIYSAYAIDASTLGSSNVRVGIITINFFQYDHKSINYFDVDCELGTDDEELTAPRCLNLVIDADYTPLDSDGFGVATDNVQGYLYWTAANTPFNYVDPDDE